MRFLVALAATAAVAEPLPVQWGWTASGRYCLRSGGGR
jgi:hypothetical protein